MPSLFEKVWNRHIVTAQTATHPAILYIDLHLIHEVTSPQAFAMLRERGLKVHMPSRTVATMDHGVPSHPAGPDGRYAYVDQEAEHQVATLAENCEAFGIRLFPLGHRHQGIVHVIGPELGLTQPGKTIVCGDSHTSTHGAFGALAFGIGTSEVGHVLATQCLLQRKPKSMAVNLIGRFGKGVGAKDLILAIIAKLGFKGGTGYALEYRGKAIRDLDMEGRMTVCNMSIEAGARTGMIAPDDITFQYLAGREYAPKGVAFDRAIAEWKELGTDENAEFDREIDVDVSDLKPMITYGTNPGMAVPIDEAVPEAKDPAEAKALNYMGFHAGKPLLDMPVDVVFIGSCTNSRIGDLRAAAAVMRGRKVAPGLQALVVPGSMRVKREAEAEGLDRIFREAGAQWREPSCSMCIAMNGDAVNAGQLAVSTSNRNFEGRQGKGSRTLLAGPTTAAACAVAGKVADPRRFIGEDAPIALQSQAQDLVGGKL